MEHIMHNNINSVLFMPQKMTNYTAKIGQIQESAKGKALSVGREIPII
jgi:hypothetical protein